MGSVTRHSRNNRRERNRGSRIVSRHTRYGTSSSSGGAHNWNTSWQSHAAYVATVLTFTGLGILVQILGVHL